MRRTLAFPREVKYEAAGGQESEENLGELKKGKIMGEARVLEKKNGQKKFLSNEIPGKPFASFLSTSSIM